MGKARVTMAIESERWVRGTDLKKLPVQAGRIMVSIGVSATGKASYCSVVRSSENASFDALVCQAILKRARFDPALDKDGQPIPSAYEREWIF